MDEKEIYFDFIKKMKKFFGDEGLIIYSRSNTFFETNSISKDDILMYYNLLLNLKKLIPQNICLPTHITCCIFFLAKFNSKAFQHFNDIAYKLNLSADPINDVNMFIIFNMIEFEAEYMKPDKNKINFLSDYLHKFRGLNKTLENFLLYQYYDALLNYLGENYDKATQSVNSLIMNIAGEVKEPKSNFIKYIEYRNQFLLLKIQIKEKKTDMRELIIAFNMNLNDIKEINKTIAIKLSFDLFDVYYKRGQFDECIKLLNETEELLENTLMSGVILKDSLEYYLGIYSRMAFIGILMLDEEVMNKASDKINTAIIHMKNDEDNQKLKFLLHGYELVHEILLQNLGINSSTNKIELANNFKGDFIGTNGQPPKCGLLVNQSNINTVILNLYTIHDMDYELGRRSTDFVKSRFRDLESGVLEIGEALAFLVGIGNTVSRRSRQFFSERNPNSEIKNLIELYTLRISRYCRDNHLYIPYIRTPFVKRIILNCFIALTSIRIFNKDVEKVKAALQEFNLVAKALGIGKRDKGYGEMIKTKADYYFLIKEYNLAKRYYKESLDLIDQKSTKIPDIYFDLGMTYYLDIEKINGVIEKNNPQKTVEYLTQAIDLFNKYSNSSELDEEHKINFSNKLEKTKNILNAINEKNNAMK